MGTSKPTTSAGTVTISDRPSTQQVKKNRGLRMRKIMQGEKNLCSIGKVSPALGITVQEGSGGEFPEEGWKGTRAPRSPHRGTLPSSVLGGRWASVLC